MSEPNAPRTSPGEHAPPQLTELDLLHRKIHRSFLGAILVSTVAVVASGFAETEPAPLRTTTFVAVGLGLGCVILRRLTTSPMISPRTELRLGVAGLACGAGLALLGAFIAWDHDAARTGLAYCGAAFILCARPPVPAHLRVRRRHIDV
jgi:hypothetical protein